MVKELTSSNWCENVDGAKELSVVFFYANWCRNCKAVMPVFKRLELGLGLGCTGLILTLPLTLTLTLTLTRTMTTPGRCRRSRRRVVPACKQHGNAGRL